MMKVLFPLILISSACLFSCKGNNNENNNTDILLLKDRVNELQNTVDSLLIVLEEKQTPALQKTRKKQTQKDQVKTSLNNNTGQSNYNWKTNSENATPSYRPKQETPSYQVRIGAICCDGTRSYATGRGACSHHGGVCKWLYQ